MPLKIAVDAMGGDYAPTEVVKGALLAARERADIQIILVGDEAAVTEELDGLGEIPASVTIRHATQTIAMGEHPVQATRRKRDSSLVVAAMMVKDGEADATFSAGSTGAAMAIATLDIGRIPGIDRPAIASTIPTIKGRCLLLDAGANVDCSPRNLLQFALLGAIYAERVLGIEQPKLGLLNIGTEDTKGDELTKETHRLLRATSLNFHGNVEGKDVFEHAVDVVVCDGFAGNVLIKSGEGMAEMVFDLLQREIDSDPNITESMDVFAPIFQRLMQRVHYSEYGGAPLLGVNGVSVIGHGRSNAKAIASGLRAAALSAGSGYVQAIREALPGFEGQSMSDPLTRRRAGILGVGSFVPPKVITNDDLAARMDTSDDWIASRTGIRARRIVEPGVLTSDLAVAAAQNALADAGLSASDLDLIIVASSTPDYPGSFPSTATVVQDRLGAKQVAAFDLGAVCAGFAYALHVAAQMVTAGANKRVLVIGAETFSRLLNWDDRSTAVLFGDGAGAAIVGEVAEGGYLGGILGADGSGGPLLCVTRSGDCPNTIFQNGKEVYKFAVSIMGEAAAQAVHAVGLQTDDIDLFIPHQANIRIIDKAAERMGLPREKVFVNLDRYGNTPAASIPLALDEAVKSGRICNGSLVVLVGFGAGLTWGANVIRWSR